MSKDKIPMRSCCGRDMRPERRQTSKGFRSMWTCGICNYRVYMNREERDYYKR